MNETSGGPARKLPDLKPGGKFQNKLSLDFESFMKIFLLKFLGLFSVRHAILKCMDGYTGVLRSL